MEQKRKMLPIGFDDFEEIRKRDYYYIDKTGLIRELLSNQAAVTLFTRPRRFGKSLNMSMLANFFSIKDIEGIKDIGGEPVFEGKSIFNGKSIFDGKSLFKGKSIFDGKSLFKGLEIAKETELCEKYMGKYPVIFLSLKGIDKPTYEAAYRRTAGLVSETAEKYEFLMESDRLSGRDKTRLERLLDCDIDEDLLSISLRLLCELLEKHYGKKAILIIDEYDVPLQKAFAYGYYDRMISLIRNMLGEALKTNKGLEFAVLTGCLRIAKESIFTGLNNLRVISISDARFDKYFGFTDDEVKGLLAYYDLADHYDETKEWYDGYRFGREEIYCPWDVLNHCDLLRENPKGKPGNYWINSSSNDAVRRFIDMADDATRQEIESLVAGEAIEKEIREELTYSEMYDSIENLWSLLYTTGYLTRQGDADGRVMRLVIPNQEVRDVFVTQIRQYFKDSVRSDTGSLEILCAALQGGDAKGAEKVLNQYLQRFISVRDTMARDEQKENFYHGVLLGILATKDGWNARSNQESGDGYADILAAPEYGTLEIGIVIELKYAHDGNLDAASQAALGQIEEKGYEMELRNEGMTTILKYGIGCCKKRCRVALGS